MNAILEGVVTIALAVVGLAIISSLVSPKAQTSAVIQSAGSAFSNSLGVAEAPVTGTSLSLSLGYPSSSNQNYMFGS